MDSAPLGVINTAVTRGGKEVHSRGGGGTVKKKIQQKNPEERIVWVEVPSLLF